MLLIHQLPPKPDYLRVKVRRRLHRLGAVLLKSSVYVLPETDENLEDFQWLANEIVADGGDATIVSGAFLSGVTLRISCCRCMRLQVLARFGRWDYRVMRGPTPISSSVS